MRIEAGNSTLRPWTTDDVESLVVQANDPLVAANLRDRFPSPYTCIDAERWLATATGSLTDFAIEVDGRAAGGIGLTPGSDINRNSAEIGYWLGRSFWGRGIATAATRSLTAYGIQTLGFNRIFAHVFAEHAPSIRVLEKAGYHFEGRLRRSAIKQGVVRDQLLYAITDRN